MVVVVLVVCITEVWVVVVDASDFEVGIVVVVATVVAGVVDGIGIVVVLAVVDVDDEVVVVFDVAVDVVGVVVVIVEVGIVFVVVATTVVADVVVDANDVGMELVVVNFVVVGVDDWVVVFDVAAVVGGGVNDNDDANAEVRIVFVEASTVVVDVDTAEVGTTDVIFAVDVDDRVVAFVDAVIVDVIPVEMGIVVVAFVVVDAVVGVVVIIGWATAVACVIAALVCPKNAALGFVVVPTVAPFNAPEVAPFNAPEVAPCTVSVVVDPTVEPVVGWSVFPPVDGVLFDDMVIFPVFDALVCPANVFEVGCDVVAVVLVPVASVVPVATVLIVDTLSDPLASTFVAYAAPLFIVAILFTTAIFVLFCEGAKR